ncbi:MAG: SlyX protein [Verrucomicrobia bacterium]|nr:SlyX protein [Verrucomicrobiota bacterium]
MPEDDPIIELQRKLTHLERHVEEQDAEHYHLAKKVDQLTQLTKQQAKKIKSLEDSGGSMPADEKPPHY